MTATGRSSATSVNSGGGAIIGGNIDTGGGDFIGRDQIFHITSLATIENLPPAPGEPPYKGLTAYTEADSTIFFGRRALVEKIGNRLTGQADNAPGRLIILAGDSGSGKTSLIRAGLTPHLKRMGWAIWRFTPGEAYLPELTASLAPDTLGGRAGGRPLLIAVDQFEELFGAAHSEEDRQAFVEALQTVAALPQTSALIAVRGDFLGRLARYEKLRRTAETGTFLIPALTETELREAIVEPARQGGWLLQVELADRIVRDLGKEPGRLPLLSHALRETWEKRRGRYLTLVGYEQAGGVDRAIAQTAESVYNGFDKAGKEAARRLFLDLTEPGATDDDGEAAPDTRRRLPLAALRQGEGTATAAVLDALVRERLVTVDRETAQVAHEALIREWPRLQGWIDADRQNLLLERELEAEARRWLAAGRDESYLRQGALLATAEAWAAAHPERPAETVRVYLAAGQEAEALARQLEKERARQLDRERRRRQAITVILVIGMVALGVALARLLWQGRSKWETIYEGNPVEVLEVAGDTLYFSTKDYGVGRWRPGEKPAQLLADGLPTTPDSRGEMLVDGIYSLAADKQRPQQLYVRTSRKGVYRSQDGGRTWQPANEGLPDSAFNDFPPEGIGQLQAVGGSVYAVLFDGAEAGLYNYLDETAVWQPASSLSCESDLPQKILSVYADGDGGSLYVGAADGLYHVDLQGICWRWSSLAADQLSGHEVTLITGNSDGAVFLAAHAALDAVGIYRLEPDGAVRRLAEVGESVTSLAPIPWSTATDDLLYALLNSGEVLAIDEKGSEELDRQPGSQDLIALETATGILLLRSHATQSTGGVFVYKE